MKFNNKSFQERYKAWKNGADYWKDIRGVNLGGDTQEEPSEEEIQAIDLKTSDILALYKHGKSSLTDTVGDFVSRMGPMLSRALLRRGYGDTAYYNALRQLAYESNYGTSNVAKTQHNYGGVGWNGKTYTTFKSDQDFVDYYANMMDKRYKTALNAKTTEDYAKLLKANGYYEDTVQNYTRNLLGMKTLYNKAVAHKQANPNQYNYNVTLNDLVEDYENSRMPINTPKIVTPAYVPPPAAQYIDQGFIDLQQKRLALEKMELLHLLIQPTPMPNAIQNMLTGNNKGKDAYGLKFWQRRGMNMHFDEGKDPYLYMPGDYDFVQARDLGYLAGPDGHWPSRNYKTGRYLKSPVHPTLYKGIISDNSLGYYPLFRNGAIYTNTWPGNERFVDIIERGIQHRNRKR